MNTIHSNEKSEVKSFLKEIRKMYQDYLEDKVTDEEISKHTVSWYVLDEEKCDELLSTEPRIKDLSTGMDFTSPSISKKRKKLIARELIKRINEILTE